MLHLVQGLWWDTSFELAHPLAKVVVFVLTREIPESLFDYLPVYELRYVVTRVTLQFLEEVDLPALVSVISGYFYKCGA